MLRKILSLFSLFMIPAAVLMIPLEAQSDPADSEDVAHMKSGLQGSDTIKGEVLRIKGEHFYVRRSDGKEVHLHTKPTTQMMGEFKKGDRIEAKVNDQNHMLSIRQAQ